MVKKERAFLDQGFRNWRKAIDYFRTHQQSECHKTATDLEIAPQTCKNIIELTNENAKKLRSAERSYFIKVMETVQFLGRQGIAFQGENENDNFTLALLFRGKDDPSISQRLNAATTRQLKKYTHHDYQNKLLEIMSKHVLSTKLLQIQYSPFFALIADEYTDISNKEQMSICIRWIDPESLSGCEDFLGFYEVQDIKSETIVKAIQDALVRFKLPFSKLRAQTYDGASNMMGRKSGVTRPRLRKYRKTHSKLITMEIH